MFNGMLAGFTPYENEYYDEEVEYDGGAMEKRGVPKKMDILKEQIMILQARNDELEQKDL